MGMSSRMISVYNIVFLVISAMYLGRKMVHHLSCIGFIRTKKPPARWGGGLCDRSDWKNCLLDMASVGWDLEPISLVAPLDGNGGCLDCLFLYDELLSLSNKHVNQEVLFFLPFFFCTDV